MEVITYGIIGIAAYCAGFVTALFINRVYLWRVKKTLANVQMMSDIINKEVDLIRELRARAGKDA